jgi:pimeloyl-ACP methyl ester carboxylesterase
MAHVASGGFMQCIFNRRKFLETIAMVSSGLIAGAAHAAPEPMWVPVPVPPQAPVQEGMVDVEGARLWFWDTGGSGHPVILLHAGTQSGAGWVYQQPVLARAGYRVIAYSRRGYYRSDAGDPDNPGVGSDDLQRLVEHLKLRTVDLVAAAQGGFFALDYTLAYSEKVRSLAVVSSLMGVTDADYVAVNARLRPKFFATLPHDFQELSPSYRAGNPEGLAAWQALQKQAIPGIRITPKMKQPLTWARLESIKIPTLLMTGDSDLYTPPSLLRMQAQHMPHAEVHIVREAGHSPYWEQPEIFNRILLAFLAKQK